MATGSVAPTFSDEQLQGFLALASDADSVELKLTVPESEQHATAAALGADPLDAHIRQVWFFDTPGLDLNREGVIVRARRVQGKRGDAVVKLRPVVPDELPDRLRKSPALTVEVDAMPGGYVCSATLKAKASNSEVSATVAGTRPLKALLSAEQREFVHEHMPAGIALSDLAPLGPILVLKLKFEPEDYDRRMVVELWMYPDGSRVLELSTKCEPGEAFQVAAETRAFLAGRGVELSGEQQAKTAKALGALSAGRAGAERV